MYGRWTSMLIALLIATVLRTSQAADPMAVPAAPPLPKISAIKVLPDKLTLSNGRDVRRVVVLGAIDGGKEIDLTSSATFKSDSDSIAITPDGAVHPKAKGDARITISAAGLSASLSVTVANGDMAPAGFVRDIQPILAKVGCNQGTCHGAAKGKDGFKLSLRGYDSEFDYQVLVNDLNGRRFDRVKPDQSLMLLKPAAGVPHEGGKIFGAESDYYKLIRQWIAEGTKPEDPSRRAVGINVMPDKIYLDLPGRSQTMVVIAKYADGTTRDVTREAIMSSSSIEVLAVKDNVVTGLRRGEGAVLVRYEGNYAAREVICMGDRTGFIAQPMPEYNYIDGHVNTKLSAMKIQPSGLCTDAEFIRRVSLDLTGQPASAEFVRAFLADPSDSKAKREKLVDELLASDDFVEYQTNKWADLLQCNSANLGQKAMWMFRSWIRDQIATNAPYDQFVRDLIVARGSSYSSPAVNYYRALKEPGKITEDVSQTFLGVRFNCNKCHDHPFERWTQNQYYQFGAYFARVAFKPGQAAEEQIVYDNFNGGEVKHPKTDMVTAPQVPFGQAKAASLGDRREPFVEWLTSAQNPYFARSYTNRAWSYLLGKGIIDPVDDIRAGNPPSNGPLLDALTDDFIKSGFNVRHLLRTIVTSRTYQLSVASNKWNEDDKINFSHYVPRRLSAEQLVDAVAIATGHRPAFGDMPVGTRASELPDGTGEAADVLGLFGKPKRLSACECERSNNFTLSHAISMVNGATVGDAVVAPNTRIVQIVNATKDDKKVIEELYLSILNRMPTAQELEMVKLAAGPKRLESAQDLAWALLNSSAFLYNR